MKRFRIILCASAAVAAALVLSFGIYVHLLKNPSAPDPLTASELNRFASACAERYPQTILNPLPYRITDAQLDVYSGAAILVDTANGCILFEKNADDVIPPASMTKLVVMYVVFQEIAAGRISLSDVVPLPPESWAVNAPPNSSLMFLGQGQTVTLEELLLGLAVASGNDAAVAVADYVSGSVGAFVDRMNAEMKKLGLEHTRFVEPSGYSELNLTTPREFAAFARTYVNRYPEALEKFHSARSIAYPQEKNLAPWHAGTGSQPPIVQQSTNKLLGVLPGCDGLKTGFIYESGYNLSLTAERGGTRFLAVMMRGPGSGSAEGNEYRVKDSTTMMEWAFGRFATRPADALEAVTVPVLGAASNAVTLIPVGGKPLTVPLIVADKTPAQAASLVTYEVRLPPYVSGAVEAGVRYGSVVYSLGGVTLQEIPLVADRDIAEGNGLKRLLDRCAKPFLRNPAS